MSIRHAERGRRAAQAAIGEELHRVDPQPIRMVTASGQRHGADAVDQTQRHHVDPDRQPALAVDPPVGVEQLGRHARIGRARDAERQLMPQRGGDHGGVLVVRGLRDPAQHQAHRRLAKHAGRFAVRAAIDFSSCGRRRVAPDARTLQRPAVADDDVRAGAHEDDGPIAHGGVEVRARGRRDRRRSGPRCSRAPAARSPAETVRRARAAAPPRRRGWSAPRTSSSVVSR